MVTRNWEELASAQKGSVFQARTCALFVAR